MTAHDIAHALAGRRAQRLADGGYLIPCPLPTHGKGRGDRNPSLSIRDGDHGLLVHCFGGCDARDVLAMLRRRTMLGDTTWQSRISEWDQRFVDAQSEARPRGDDDAVRIKRAREIWDAARDPRDTLADVYLQLRRLALDDAITGNVLRFHPRCPWRDENTGTIERVSALIAAFRSLDDDEITAVHRIALKPDGHKRGRRMLGLVHGSAIKLDREINGELAVGEGVETCMPARLLGIRPTWALGSIGMISHFPLLPHVQTLRIIGENDTASEDALTLCGGRRLRAGRRVRVIKPTFDRKDLNDALGAHAYDGTGR